MSATLYAEFAAWFEAARSKGRLRVEIVESAQPLVTKLEDEVVELGGPYEKYGFGDETLIASGTHDGGVLSQLARPGRQYLLNACRVIYALEAEVAIARIRGETASA